MGASKLTRENTGRAAAQSSKTLGDFAPELPRPAVVCTLVKITGSAPQEVGARMWVAENRAVGTLGGGELEWRALKDARELLEAPRAKPRLKEYVLCKDMGQCCGGRVEVFFEPVRRRKAVHLFGGGHVGRAAAQVLSGTPFEIHLVDSRAEWAGPEGLPEDVQAHRADPLEYARSRAWEADDAVCILTHDHDLDFLLSKYFLTQPLGYLGLIGSEHKAKVFQTRLESDRLAALWDEKMHCPIGAQLGKNPKIVAVSIASELLRYWGSDS